MLANEEDDAKRTKEKTSDFIKRMQASDASAIKVGDLYRLENIVAMEYIESLGEGLNKAKFRNINYDTLYQEYKNYEKH